MKLTIAPPHPYLGRFDQLDRERGEATRYYIEWVGSDPRMKGRVLDVGSGGDYPTPKVVRALLEQCGQHDGVDPNPAIANHPALTERWCAPIEEAPLPAEAYDAMFSFWVAEHIRDPDRFAKQAIHTLKPGGVFYAFTPHALHPFPLAVRMLQMINLKRLAKRRMIQQEKVFPAYYRMNRLGSIARAAERAGFAAAEFHYLPSVQWDHYFPRPLRFLPNLYDRLIGVRFQRAAQVIAYRLEKGA